MTGLKAGAAGSEFPECAIDCGAVWTGAFVPAPEHADNNPAIAANAAILLSFCTYDPPQCCASSEMGRTFVAENGAILLALVRKMTVCPKDLTVLSQASLHEDNSPGLQFVDPACDLNLAFGSGLGQ